jgi:phosphoadenosine phosphosulfate reductase
MKEQLLPTFEASAQDMIDMALAMPLDIKIEKAIALLQAYESKALEYDADGYWCCDSFGKDSGVIVHLCKLAGVKHKCHHNLTTIDPPELILFGKKHRSNTVIHRPSKHLVLQRMIELAKPPTRMYRWCCDEYKEHGGNGFGKIIGVRIAESARRAGIWRNVNQNKNGGLIFAPIAYWTDEDVWSFHKMFDLPYCSIYDEGWDRLGCIGCPYSGTEGQKRSFARWPAYERLWRKGFQKMWDKWHGVPNRKGQPRWFEKFGSADETFVWWLSGKGDSTDRHQCIFEEMMSNT